MLKPVVKTGKQIQQVVSVETFPGWEEKMTL